MIKKVALFMILVLFTAENISCNATLVRVACVGDSITYGSGIADRESDTYPIVLGKLLGDGYEVRNFGVGGARVSGISRKPFTKQPEYIAAVEYQPQIVVIALGINDTSVNEWRQNAECFKKDYSSIIQSFKRLGSNPQIYMTTLMPVFPPYGKYLEIQPNIRQASEFIKVIATAERIEIIDLYTRLNCEPGIYSKDGIHPSKEGAEIIANTVYKAITGNYGGLKVTGIFGNNMIIQRDMPIKVWGTADRGKVVSVEFSSEKKTCIADINGRWLIEFASRSWRQVYSITVGDGNTGVRFDNILLGDVWLCAGQSNMQWQFRQDGDYSVEKNDTDYPQLRLLNLEGVVGTANKPYSKQQIDSVQVGSFFKGQWICSSQAMSGEISAVAYYFGREIHRATGIPIGIVNCSVGGSTMEGWMPRDAFDTIELAALLDNWLESDAGPDWPKQRAAVNLSLWKQSGVDQRHPHHPYEPCFLYNSGIRPMSDFCIKGVLWYQGESNATQADASVARDVFENGQLFKKLIASWRDTFTQPDLPFYYVQIPGMERNWMDFRQMQFDLLKNVPNVAMAVTIDLGDRKNIHPRHKKEVGKRLSLPALANLYGKSEIVFSGPLAKKVLLENNNLIIEFEHTGNGLKSSDGYSLRGFELSIDGYWQTATAVINEDRVEILLTGKIPSSVRYAWQPFPDCNLVNSAQLPASPFILSID